MFVYYTFKNLNHLNSFISHFTNLYQTNRPQNMDIKRKDKETLEIF